MVESTEAVIAHGGIPHKHPLIETTIEVTEDGQIEITNGKVFITKPSVCSLSLPVPLTVDNGKDLTVYDTTGHPHEIGGVFAGGYTLATMNGDYTAVTFTAFNGIWYTNGAVLS